MTYDKILIATDDSEPARAAAEEAITIAKSFDATLHTLYVLQTAGTPPWFEDPAAEPGVDTKAGQALESIVSAADNNNLGSEVVTAVVEGQTAPAIVKYAREHEIDLIVMGTHGRSGIDRLIVGSVAEHVVRESPVPVMTVQAD